MGRDGLQSAILSWMRSSRALRGSWPRIETSERQRPSSVSRK
jgi:hypothetical protein